MIDLYYWTTPNGHKITIALEELGLPYRIRPVNIGKGEQFEPAFLRISPNNRIPAIVDDAPADGQGPLSIFESGAILSYLAEKTGRLLPAETRGKFEVLQWVFWQVGGLGPMAGQNHHFVQYAPEQIPYAVDRYVKETARLYRVMDTRLADRPYLAGDYSIADIATWAWVYGYKWSGVSIDGLEHLERWIKLVGERPAVRRGKDIPERTDIEEMIRKADESTAKVRGILA